MKCDSAYLPVLLRQARERLGWSQESVAKGLCAVSYLSKIENGKIIPTPDLAQELIRRLGLSMSDSVQSEIERKLDRFYDHRHVSFSQEEISSMESSTAVIDAKLVSYQDGKLDSLTYFEPFFDERQRRKYDELRFWKEEISEQTFLDRYNDFEAYSFLAEVSYRHEELFRSLDLWHEALYIAQKKMNIEQMLEALMGEVVARGILRDIEGMERVGEQAKQLAIMTQDDQVQESLAYNIGASLLEADRIDEALDHLLGCKKKSAFLYHKIALCYEKQGKTDLARKHIELAQEMEPSVFFDAVSYRLDHPDHLREDEYKALLEDCLIEAQEHYHHGFYLFHLRYMLEVLETRRQYKEAYALLKRHFFTFS